MVALVHLAGGIGNLVFATPLLIALNELGYTVDLRLSADYDQAADLFHGWSVVRRIISGVEACSPGSPGYDVIVPAIPPFLWSRFRCFYPPRPNSISRPPDALFYENEQAYYLAFAQALSYPANRHPEYSLPIGPGEFDGVTNNTIVLAPGCKTGEMAYKRWPGFVELAALLSDVAVVGTADDLAQSARGPLVFPPLAHNFIGRLSLRETAELMAGAGLVIANDRGLAHVAAAIGVPTMILFGPTPDRTLGPMPPNVTVLRSGLPCEPCWFGRRFEKCRKNIDCLRNLDPGHVASMALRLTQPVERGLV